VNNSAAVTVVVSRQALVASIAGGSQVQSGFSNGFSLDGSGSYDPDASDGDGSDGGLAFAWDCAPDAATADCSGLPSGDLVGSSVLSVGAGLLPVGAYRFTLKVSDAPGYTSPSASPRLRNSTAAVQVEVLAGSLPKVSIRGTIAQK